MFPNQNYGRFTVLDDGTMVIRSVQMEDSGDYVCQGLNVAGSAVAKVKLEVKGQSVYTSIVLYCIALYLFAQISIHNSHTKYNRSSDWQVSGAKH